MKLSERVEEVQSKICDVITIAIGLKDDLDNAECCETAEDVAANLKEAIEKAAELTLNLKSLRKELGDINRQCCLWCFHADVSI